MTMLAAALPALIGGVGSTLISKAIGGGSKEQAPAPERERPRMEQADKPVALPDADQKKVEFDRRRKMAARGKQSGRQATILSQNNNPSVTGFGG